MNTATAFSSNGIHPAARASGTIRAGLMTLFVAFGLGGSWAIWAPLSGAIVASGVIKVDSHRKTLQHLEGGLIQEIRVREGDHVDAGQTLIVLGDEKVSAELEILRDRIDAEMAKAARLQAERSGAALLHFPEALLQRRQQPKVEQFILAESRFFETKRHALEEQVGLMAREAEEIRREITGLETQTEAEQAAAGFVSQELAANTALSNASFVPKVQVMRLQRTIEDYRVKANEHRAAIAKAKQRVVELELRGAGLRSRYSQDAANELTETQAKLADLEQRLRPSRDAVKRQFIVAPIAGRVVDLKVFTAGGAIAPREPLLDIVPDHDPLIVDARVQVQDIDNISAGMAADLRLSAYAARDTPLLVGTVARISADRLADPATGAPYYSAQVEIRPESLAAAPELALYPGMPVEVFIKTGERTALDYVLAPVTHSLRRAMREP